MQNLGFTYRGIGRRHPEKISSAPSAMAIG
jgi:hypothetical protein